VKRIRTIILVLVILIIASGTALFLVGAFRPKSAGLQIETNPESSVFIDDVLVGRTPYEETRKPGEVVVKLIPDSFEKPLVPYETKINLIDGVETVVSWNFRESYDLSSGEIVSFEKTNPDEVELSIVSMPDSAQIQIDDQIKAFAPYKTSTLSQGEHKLVVIADGFKEKIVRIRTLKGYKLTVVVKLEPSEEVVEEEITEEEITEEEVVEVEILSTPTGFLRVRVEATTQSEEVGRVEPGEKYLFIEEDEETGWFKIEYEEGQEGWVSNTYSKKVELEDDVDSNTTPTPTQEEE